MYLLFFRKEKMTWWRLIENVEEFLEVYASLGSEQELSETIFEVLQKCVCVVYNQKKCKNVNQARANIFWKYFDNGKIADLSLLPPCESTLLLHAKRSDYIARAWRLANRPLQLMDEPKRHGWMDDFTIQWVDKMYPEDVTDLLIGKEDNNEEEESSSEESLSDSSDGAKVTLMTEYIM